MLLLPKRLWMKVKTVSSIKGLWDLYFPCHALILLYPFRSQSTAVDSWVRILSHDLSCINYVWSENIYNKMHLSHRNYKEPTYICRRNTNLTTFISFFVSFSLSPLLCSCQCFFFFVGLFNFCFHSVVCPNIFFFHVSATFTHTQTHPYIWSILVFVDMFPLYLVCICMQTRNNVIGRLSNWIEQCVD